MAVNRKYKDSVFRSIFNNKKNLLELYNAIEGTNYQDESIIEINTLEEAIFSARKNDISFSVNKKMVVLIEHQSTINENIPLRILSYITRIYENIVDKKIYWESGKIPRPDFVVLYNGKAPFPEKKCLRLSDIFEETEDNDLILLDLIVRVFNINKGYNPDLERKSKTLDDYAIFIAKVREYERKYPLKEAVKLAVKYCIKKNILEDYFRQNSSEVVSMNFIKYNEKDAIREARKESREKGREEGIEVGVEKGKKEVQNYKLNLKKQRLSGEELKKKKKKMSQKKQ
jgi:hypothetical protein